jgi:PPOX class F420-dependent enzyme/OxyR family protein
MSFAQEEIDFIHAQPLARIATVDDDGQPDVVPVGFEFDGTYFNIGGLQPANTRRHHNVSAGNHKVALVIDDVASTEPWSPRFLRIYGTAEVMSGEYPYLRVTPTISWSSNLSGEPLAANHGSIPIKRTVHQGAAAKPMKDKRAQGRTHMVMDNRLILRGAKGYDEARVARIFNARRPERYPAAVLVAESENDVVEGVRLARDRGWQVAIRSGGHSNPAWSLRDDALLIDLGGFKETALDTSSGIVSVTPSVTGGELNAYLNGYGRFFSTGDCPSVGVGGFLLQGGISVGFRGWGYAAEQIVALDVVTADGELLRADEHTNTDLFWAARGAGPGFCGAITRFHLKTRPVPAGLAATMHVYPLERYGEVLDWVLDIHPHISPDVGLTPIAVVPPFPVPGADKGGLVFVVLGLAHSASRDEALEVLAPLAQSPFLSDALMVQHAKPTTIPERLEFGGSVHPEGMRYLVDSAWVDATPQEIVAASKQLLTERPNDTRGHVIFDLSLPRDDVPDMAMSLRAGVMIASYIIYQDQHHDAAYEVWHRDAMKPLEPFTVGGYWGDSDQTQREVKMLTDEAWTRLQQIRARRDPDRLFADYPAGPGGFRNVNGWESQS